MEKTVDKEWYDILRLIAPGTDFREGLENVLKARTGALIVVGGDGPNVIKIVDGGFAINKDYTAALIYELAKMDGAIVLSKDCKKILYANAQLIPDSTISTEETGTRHRTAERVAKQTGEVVISVSQRRNIITLFKGNYRYIIKDTTLILTRANQALQTLQKYKSVLDTIINNLNALEFEDIVTLENVAVAVQRAEMVLRIVSEIEGYIIELGDEGRLINMQLEELISNTQEEELLVIQDYMVVSEQTKLPEQVLEILRDYSYDELMDLTYVCKALGYVGGNNSLDLNITPKGNRILNKVPRVPPSIIKNLIDKFINLQGILIASIDELDDVEGIGEIRAKNIKEGLRRMREQVLFDLRLFR